MRFGQAFSQEDVISIHSSSRKREKRIFRVHVFPIEGSIFADIVSMERSKKLGRENTTRGPESARAPKRQCRALNPGLLMLHPCYWVEFQRQCSIEHGAPISQDLLPSCRPFPWFSGLSTTNVSIEESNYLRTEYLSFDLLESILFVSNFDKDNKSIR